MSFNTGRSAPSNTFDMESSLKLVIQNIVRHQIKRRLLAVALVAGMALMSSGVQCKDDAMSRRAEEKNVELPSKYFINKNFLRCGGTDVLILTSCVDYEEALPFCFNQHINIYDSKTSRSSSLNYNYLFNEGNQQLIAKADCEHVDGKDYLILESTNFGNCDRCEWIDVYWVNGKYLGSSKGMYDSKNFSHSPIPQKLAEFLLSDNVPMSASTEISRAHSRQQPHSQSR